MSRPTMDFLVPVSHHVMSRHDTTSHAPDRPDACHRFRFTQSSTPPTIVSPALLPYAHNPLLSFLGLPTDIVRERVDEVREKGEIFSFTFVPDGQGDEGTACGADEDWYPEDWHTRGKGMVRVRGPASWLWRCKWVHFLPSVAASHTCEEVAEPNSATL